MANNTSNILVGAANLAIGTPSGTLPTTLYTDGIYNSLKTVVGGSVPRNYRSFVTGLTTSGTAVPLTSGSVLFKDAGLTQEGVEVTYSPEYGEVEVDQVLDAAKLFKQKMSVMVKTTFAEATLENLLVVWDSAAANFTGASYDEGGAGAKGLLMNPGNLGDSPQERVLLFVGQKPGGTTGVNNQRVYLASRAISVSASTHGVKRSDATVFPVEFRLLPDLGASTQQYGRIVDIA